MKPRELLLMQALHVWKTRSGKPPHEGHDDIFTEAYLAGFEDGRTTQKIEEEQKRKDESASRPFDD